METLRTAGGSKRWRADRKITWRAVAHAALLHIPPPRRRQVLCNLKTVTTAIFYGWLISSRRIREKKAALLLLLAAGVRRNGREAPGGRPAVC